MSDCPLRPLATGRNAFIKLKGKRAYICLCDKQLERFEREIVQCTPPSCLIYVKDMSHTCHNIVIYSSDTKGKKKI